MPDGISKATPFGGIRHQAYDRMLLIYIYAPSISASVSLPFESRLTGMSTTSSHLAYEMM
jgi:hypothetical protein